MEKWNFIYVENLVWVKKYANNNIVAESSQFFKRSKATLFIFRKNSSSHIELKHQRNPDVHYDFLRRTGVLTSSFFSQILTQKEFLQRMEGKINRMLPTI